MNYTLHQLQIFLKICETQSVTKAANLLHLTQPAVSIQLKKLQEQFEIPLTEVIGRKLYITEFGREIAEAAARIIQEVHEIGFKADAYRGFLSGQLSVSVVSTAKYFMPYFLAGFLRKHPGIDLKMDVTNKASVVKSLEDNEVDFAMVSVVPDLLDIERVELMKNKLFLIAGKDIEMKGPEMLREVPLIFREKGSATRSAMEGYLDRQDVVVRRKIELTSNEAVKQAVLAGLGVSIIPLIGIKNELQNGSLHIVPSPHLPLVTDWNLVWLRQKKLSPVATAFLDFIRTEKDRLISEKFNWFNQY